jgi:hypothetical protein
VHERLEYPLQISLAKQKKVRAENSDQLVGDIESTIHQLKNRVANHCEQRSANFSIIEETFSKSTAEIK